MVECPHHRPERRDQAKAGHGDHVTIIKTAIASNGKSWVYVADRHKTRLLN
jgi:ribosomal protein S17